MGLRKLGEFEAVWSGMVGNFGLEFLGHNSEKGSTRKHTEKRVTSWGILFWGNLAISRCFTKRILMGEFKLAIF
jgi:hypothetical protein